jgi:transcriptional regulator with XRE-family HTH domain
MMQCTLARKRGDSAVATGSFDLDAGRALRRARLSRGLTLREVGIRSNGAFKATAVAGYERGERSISLRRFFELAKIYEIPPERLLSDLARIAEGRPSTVIDLARLETLEGAEARAVAGFVRNVRELRGDRSSTITLRSVDLAVIATSAGTRPEVLLERIAPALRES